ncbi:Sugar kinase of the NBD/HSP70 family, may contain an N-terminal HTH domain [Lentzea fradiae]|uniref:Sugar kinase of the NBD/HSP70 family, may contain an N-terminal HTH domain n=1 Tax=Lentzea fradiae TaxID=200378 RepID=A0A1G7UJV6_9PSEU|nr:ROK family protein [Lentzea fradiae]SDG47842.1 Sugar kinase of the NBD/HSP70 family, may contain an N-terminal HTH domain [Lentzea fradiae]
MVRARATVRDLRRQNRSVLLTALFLDGPLSRLQLSASTGLSAATASTITGELLDEGLLTEAGSVESDGGRPRVLLRVNPVFGHVVGVDVGETGIKVELFDLAMTRLSTVDLPVAAVRPGPVSELVAAGVAQVLSASGVPASSVLGVGVGVPGTVERGTSAVVHAQTIGWDAVPLERMIREAGVEPPLFVENGAKTQGQAEMWFGAGRGARHAVIVLVGSGVGVAVVTGGVMHRGATSNAGEWGHTTIVYGGRRCRCGVRGCLEAYAGAEAMLGRYREAARDGSSAPDQVSALEELLTSRSAAARRVVEESVGYLGAGIANLVNLFNPERVVLGGWAGLALGARQLDRIVAATAEHALRHPYAQVRIELGRTGPDAVAVGAATLPVAALLETGADPRSARRAG